MKIVHIIFSFQTGGAETMLVDIINQQVKNNQVHLLVINNLVDGSLLNKIDRRVKLLMIGRKEKSKNPLPILKLNYVLLKSQPDVIHCHNEAISRLVFLKKKIVFTIHTMNVTTNNLNEYDNVIAISNAVKVDIERRCNIKPDLIYNGVRTEDIICKNDYSFNIFRILQIGRLEHLIKGQDVLLEALKIVVYDKGIKNIHTDFIGAGQSLEYLQNLVSDYRLENHVTFLGIKDRDHIYEHLKDYNLLVQPSLYEGFGLTVVEAMAAKVPVLVSDIDGPAEIIEKGHYGYLFKSGDSPDCANTIWNIINDYGSNQFMKKIKAAHNQVCKRFDVKVMVRALENIYL